MPFCYEQNICTDVAVTILPSFKPNICFIYFLIKIYCNESSNVKAKEEFKNMVKKKELLQVYTSDTAQTAEGTTHSFSDSERIAFCDWINSSLAEDNELMHLQILPLDMNSDGDLFKKVQNGILLW